MNNDKIKRAVTLMLTGTACNFDCTYCYRKGQGIKDRNTPTKFNYSVKHMLKALSKKRLGGRAIICLCGGGETLLHKDVVPLIKGLLHEGHVVDLITNLTLNHRIDELLEAPREDLERLILKASFHYLELKRLNKLDDYFNNFNRLIKAGASGSPILTVCEEYLPLLDEIKEVCLERINDLPHLTAAIDNFDTTMETRSFYTEDFISMIKEKFDSKIFETFDTLLKISPKDHFCYSGLWNITVNAETGETNKCFYAPINQNIFKNLHKKIDFEPIGQCCTKPHCALNYNWQGMGMIPELKDFLTYSKMMFRPNTYNPKVLELLDFKFSDTYSEYTEAQKEAVNRKNKFPKISLKNKLRLKIYNHYKTILEAKGLV